jgi:BirA family biotin operon repressor/biotin-[acetyl-CoA-carboxylase] ligase
MLKKRLGAPIIYLKSTKSTQDVVKDAALKGAPEGYTVVAENLEQARGRMGRPFYTAKGGLYFSLLLRPNLKISEITVLPLAVGVAVAKSIEDESLGCALKWPNDCLVNSRKVCGVLVESATKGENLLYVIVGVGLNANIPIEGIPEWLRAEATTLQHELGRSIDLPSILNRILAYFEWLYDDLQTNGPPLTLNEWLKRDILRGRSVTIEYLGRELTVVVRGLSENGLLMVESKEGRINLNSAEVTIKSWLDRG